MPFIKKATLTKAILLFCYFAKKDDVDPQYGQLYDVYWQAWKSETGMTPSVCYSKKIEDHE